MRVIGLMSGTSADAIDAALVEWTHATEPRPFRLVAYRESPHSPELQQRIHALAAGRTPDGTALRELAALDVELGERFADAAVALAKEAGVPLESVDAIASHGQTVAHHPELRASLQIGDPSRIAERTGVTTIADFRTRDLAAGGEGAPLAPFFHLAAFGSADEARIVLNLGGIANVTYIPRGAAPESVQAFDVGPANALIDGVVRAASGGRERVDADGARARRGRVNQALLAQLMDDDFLRMSPPKSTGRERYGTKEADALWEAAAASGLLLEDLLATLCAFTAEAVAHACRTHLRGGGAVQRVLVGGGGVRNGALMDALRRALPGAPVEPCDAHGVPSDAAEAMAFALLGRNALLGIPNHLPQTTGARRAAVLGEFVPGRSGKIR